MIRVPFSSHAAPSFAAASQVLLPAAHAPSTALAVLGAAGFRVLLGQLLDVWSPEPPSPIVSVCLVHLVWVFLYSLQSFTFPFCLHWPVLTSSALDLGLIPEQLEGPVRTVATPWG